MNNFKKSLRNKAHINTMSYRKLLYGAMAIVFAVSLVPYQVKAAASTPPRGWLDSCVVGWALDVNTPDKPIDVHIYVDKLAGVDNNSGFVEVLTTNVVRDDVNAAYHRPAGEKHGFEWSAPKRLFDGQTHTVYVYGIDTTDTSGSSNALLDGAPKQCQWSGGTDTSSALTVTSPTAGEQWRVGTQHTISWVDTRGNNATGGKYTVQLEPYIACLYATPIACRIAQPEAYTIVQSLAGSSFSWNIPNDLPSRYRAANRIRVTLDNSDVSGLSPVFSIASSTAAITVSSDVNPLVATVGQPFDASFTIAGGTSPYTASIDGPLPGGMSFQVVVPSCAPPVEGIANCLPPTYHLMGTPTAAGNFPFVIQAQDSAGQKGSAGYTLLVNPTNPNDLVITQPTNLSATVGQAFSASFSVSGGTAPYQWQQAYGAVPDGINITFPAFNCITTPCVNPYDTAIFKGTPTRAGSVTATFRVTDAAGRTKETTFTITVAGQTDKVVRTGYVDVATGQRVEGWAFDSTKTGACVTITYKPQTGTSDNARYTQDVCPTMTRTDAEQWVRTNFGDGYAITQPLGFRADPTLVLPPGTYLVAGAKLKDSGVTIELGESAKFPITITDTTIASGPIVITSPAKGASYKIGDTINVAWTGSNSLPVTIKLVERRDCEAVGICPSVLPREYLIAGSYGGAGYNWTIPSTVVPGNYRVHMTTSATGVDYVLWGQSGIFAVTNGSVGTSPLQVTSPAAGDKVYAGDVKNIVWNVLADIQGLLATISYNYTNHPACRDVQPPCALPDTLVTVPITTSAPNTGTYAWSVPSTLSGQYTVTVSVGGVSDESDSFTILPRVDGSRGITITSPTKEDVWRRGETHTIYWTPNVANTKVKVEATRYIACLHNSTYICAVAQPAPVVIETSAPDTGSFEWNIPKDFTITGPVTVTITNASTGKVGESAPFEIADGVSDNPCSAILPGQVVVGTSGTVYVITPECKKYGFTSLQDLTSRGYSLNQVQKVDQAALDAIPTVEYLARPANTSFKYSNQRAIYYLSAAGCKETYPSTVTLRAWGVATSSIVTIPTTEQYPDCNPSFVQLPNNTWAQVSGEPTIYHIEGTVMRPYTSLGALISSGFQNAKLYVIRTAEFGLYTVGDPIQ